jgi:hypothetical protein
VGGGGCERLDTRFRWLWRRTCPGDSDKRRDQLGESCGGYSDRPHIRRCQAVPDCHSALGPCADPGPNDALARGGDFTRASAFDVVLAPAVEIAHTIAYRLTIAFAYGIPVPVPLVIDVAAGGLRPTGPRQAVRGV